MGKKFFDFLWILSSLSLYFLFFKVSNSSLHIINHWEGIWDYIVIVILLILPLLIKFIFCKFIPEDETLEITAIRSTEINYIPTYIGYFVIATSISDITAFWVITVIVAVLIYATKMFYFNPVLLLLGYHYYEVTNTTGTTLLLISKKKDLKIANSFKNLRRLNNYVFFDNKGGCVNG
jgi:uncharacterized membrane protein YbhN (UPF0104 family)